MKATKRVTSDQKSGHITPATGNIFADLGFPAGEAKALLKDADARIEKSRALKRQAAAEIAAWIEAESLTQLAAAEILAVSRPRVSDLVNSKLTKFSMDTLISMLFRTGKNVDLRVS